MNYESSSRFPYDWLILSTVLVSVDWQLTEWPDFTCIHLPKHSQCEESQHFSITHSLLHWVEELSLYSGYLSWSRNAAICAGVAATVRMVEKGFDPATTLFANTFITGELTSIELGSLFVEVSWLKKIAVTSMFTLVILKLSRSPIFTLFTEHQLTAKARELSTIVQCIIDTWSCTSVELNPRKWQRSKIEPLEDFPLYSTCTRQVSMRANIELAIIEYR